MFLVILREHEASEEILFVQIFDDIDEAKECFEYLTNAILIELDNHFMLDLISIEESTEDLLPKIVFTLSTLQSHDVTNEEFIDALENKKAWKLNLLSVDYTGEEFHVDVSTTDAGVRWKFTIEAETPEIARKKAIRHIKKVSEKK